MTEIIQISKEVIEALRALAKAAFSWRLIEDGKSNLPSTTEPTAMPRMM